MKLSKFKLDKYISLQLPTVYENSLFNEKNPVGGILGEMHGTFTIFYKYSILNFKLRGQHLSLKR